MAKLEQYRTYVERILQEYSRYKPTHGEVEVQVMVDREHDYYQLNRVGWHKDQRIYGCLLHLDIKGGKIWIQYDGTEDGVADELLALGVPKADIVLAFHPPYKRPYTGFAVN